MRKKLYMYIVICLCGWLAMNASGVSLKPGELSEGKVVWKEDFRDTLSSCWEHEGQFRLENVQFVAESNAVLGVSLKEKTGEIKGWWQRGKSTRPTVFLINQDSNRLQASFSPMTGNGLNLCCETEVKDPLGRSTNIVKKAGTPILFEPTMTYWCQAEKDSFTNRVEKPPKYDEVWNQWRVVWDDQAVGFWFNGRLIGWIKSESTPLHLRLELADGDRLQIIQQLVYSTEMDYIPLDLTAYCNGRSEVFKGITLTPFLEAEGQVRVHGVPFKISKPLPGATDYVDLSVTKWRRSTSDLYNHAEAGAYGHDHLNAFNGDPASMVLRVPKEYYTDLYVLAFSESSTNRTPVFSLRMGDFERGFLYMQSARVPSCDTKPEERSLSNCWPVGDTGVWVVRVPLNPAEIQHVLRSSAIEPDRQWLDIGLSRELGLFRAYPDPYTCCVVPLGLPSGVKLLAATLKRSPVEMFVDSPEAGHIFMKNRTPVFRIHLKNCTQTEQHLRLEAQVEDYYGNCGGQKRQIILAAKAEQVLEMDFPQTGYGWYKVEFDLYQVQSRPRLEIPRYGDELLMRRSTSFAHLSHLLVKPHPKSCYGVWVYCGGHYTNPSFEENALFMEKAGFRWSGTFGPTDEETLKIAEKYGIMWSQVKAIGYEFPAVPWKESNQNLDKIIETQKNMPWVDSWTLLHEHYHLSPERYQFRYPDPVLGKDPPPLTKEEREGKVGVVFSNLVEYCKRTKEARPDTKIVFGHSNPSVNMPWFMMGFDRRYFDAYGLEPMMRMRMPERQPDMAGNRIYWAQEVLKYFGMGDTPLRTHESGFYPTGPGWQTEADQADMSVRFHLCYLAFPQFERFSDVGMLVDYAGYYGYSGWGPTGYLNHYPECNPKPAYVAMATMMRMLDGPVGDLPRPQILKILDMGSRSLFGLEFKTRSNGIVHVFWTLTGERPVNLSLAEGKGEIHVTDAMGNLRTLKFSDNKTDLTITTSPIYVRGLGDIRGIQPGTPRYSNRPGPWAEEIDGLESVTSWKAMSVEEMKAIALQGTSAKGQEGLSEPTLGIDQTKADIIRCVGNFKIETVLDDEMKANVWEVTPQPVEGHPLIPMYQILRRDEPLVIDSPRERIGVWVKGNSGWGRIMFGFTDAKGNKWLSMETKDEWNTEDIASETWIHFDGWRYIDIGLPAFYADGIQKPAANNWRYTGKFEIVYPIRIDTLVIQLQNEIVYLNKTVPVDPKSIRLRGLTVSD